MLRVVSSFRCVTCSDERLIGYVNGEYKSIEADPSLFLRVLDVIRQEGTRDAVHLHCASECSTDEVNAFIAALIDEGIVVDEDAPAQSSLTLALIGDPKRITWARAFIPKSWTVVECSPNSDPVDAWSNPSALDLALYLPGDATMGDALAINRWCVDKDLPYVVIRSLGAEVIAGPFVVPYRGACLACCLEHHKDLLKTHDAKGLEDDVWLAFPFSSSACEEGVEMTYRALLQTACAQLQGWLCETASFELFEREQVCVPTHMAPVRTNHYVARTDCPCCHGLQRKIASVDPTQASFVPTINDPRAYVPIAYRSGGYRTADAATTEATLSACLERTGLSVDIRLDPHNPFNDFLPVYDAKLALTHKNKTPYFFGQQWSHGKGVTKQQAYFSAAFELLERLSARYVGEMPLITGSIAAMGEHAIDVRPRFQTVDRLNHPFDRYDPNLVMDWVWGYSLCDRRPKLVPADVVFLNNIAMRGHLWSSGSSGLSAACTLEDAIFQGLMEVIEHDAWMIAQARVEVKPRIVMDGVTRESTVCVVKAIEEQGFDVIIRDYTNDTGVPVYRTWIVDPNNYEDYALEGFGASLDPEIALERSISEAVQGRGKIIYNRDTMEYSPSRMSHVGTYRNSLYALGHFRMSDITSDGGEVRLDRHRAPDVTTVSEAIDETIQRLTSACPEADVVFVNMTKRHIGMPVVKVIVTDGLQMFGDPILVPSRRLLQGVSEPNRRAYEDLYLGPFPH